MTIIGVKIESIETYLKEVIRLGGTDLLITPGLAGARARRRPARPDQGRARRCGPTTCADMIEGLLTDELLARAPRRARPRPLVRVRRHAPLPRELLLPQRRARDVGARHPARRPDARRRSASRRRSPRACDLKQGFVLVTGPTGSGKSTTLASMIEYINLRRPVHILTIEDPIEYTHQHRVAAIDQREVGVDTQSFARALRSALREDPDVILVGEMRDPETIQFALDARRDRPPRVRDACTRTTRRSRSIASPTSSRPNARPRSGCSSRRRSRRSCRSGCSRASAAGSSPRSSCWSRTTRCATSFARAARTSCAT